MKRTSVKLKLKQRLELVRTTVRELTPAEIGSVRGGNTEGNGGELATAACTSCCDWLTYGQAQQGS